MVAIMTKSHNKIVFFENKVNVTGITVTFRFTVAALEHALTYFYAKSLLPFMLLH